MSLYYDAASIISNSDKNDSSLKTRVYGAKNLKAAPAQVYALISEASKWNEILNEVVERSTLLVQERKLTPALAVLLVHDLLLAKKGVAAPASHALRTTVERHRARLQAEFTKARLRRGCATIDALREKLQSGSGQASDGANDNAPRYQHPRWVRINTLRSDLEKQLSTTFADFERVSSLASILSASTLPPPRILHVDEHVPDLIALPSNIDLTTSQAYRKGEIILQDKASCFPAYMIDPAADDGDIVDACAAPGNKTTHLAALIGKQGKASQQVWACERDKPRAITLQRMVDVAGATKVTVKAGQDFLRLRPNDGPWDKVGALLLDPSCSGSGIIGREPAATFVLPEKEATPTQTTGTSKKRKRNNKLKQIAGASESLPAAAASTAEEDPEDIKDKDDEARRARLQSLSAFQTKIILHAFSFPSARRVVYSTCSIHDEENERVVLAALESTIARERGWKILERQQQVAGMQSWKSRGRASACGEGKAASIIADACIRCDKHNIDGTQGFFVAGFVRDTAATQDDTLSDEEEWEGFDDQD